MLVRFLTLRTALGVCLITPVRCSRLSSMQARRAPTKPFMLRIRITEAPEGVINYQAVVLSPGTVCIL